DLSKQGLEFTASWDKLSDNDVLIAKRGSPPAGNDWEAKFDRALKEGRILPGKPGTAFALLSQVNRQDPKYPDYQNRLRVALEEAGKKIISVYLEGNQVPQKQPDFQDCAAYYKAALDLTPESVYLHARQLFCDGRATLFDKKWRDALDELEYAVRLDTS